MPTEPVRAAGKPTICLNMIVRDEAHVVRETLDLVAPHIDTWVIVDTGSSDGTQEVIRDHMASLGIGGELIERPWRDFGSNRTEALELCRGRADYAWVIDADDLVVGELDLSALTADSYLLRYGDGFRYWRKQLFRDGLRWRYVGSVHEWPACDDLTNEVRLEGDYHVESRRLGARNTDPDKYLRDAELLRTALKRDPDDTRSAFYLAQSLADAGDREGALEWYTRRSEMGGWTEEVFCSHLRRGGLLEALGRPWEESLSAYLSAWQARPTRAEPLHEIARHHRLADEFHLGHLYARRAAEIPFPDEDLLYVAADVYSWRAADELAICSFYVGEVAESFALCSELLAGDTVPEGERERVAANRDLCVPAMLERSAEYPAEIVERLTDPDRPREPAGQPLTLSITSCRRPFLFERTVNSFLNCCEDIDLVDRFVCVDNGSSEPDRQRMRELYPFFDFIYTDPSTERHAEGMNRILEIICGKSEEGHWLHLEDDWHFFAPGPIIGRAREILADDGAIGQVAFNVNYGETLADRRIIGGEIRRTGAGGRRYRLHRRLEGDQLDRHIAELGPRGRSNAYWPHFTLRPSLVRVDAAARVGRFRPEAGHFELEFAERWSTSGSRTAFFDEIVCLHTGRLTSDTATATAPSAYELVGDGTHPAHRRGGLDPGSLRGVVINLTRREDRRRSFRTALAGAAGEGFAARLRRFEAVDGLELEMSAELEYLFRGNDFAFRRGIVACALSHLAVWREVAASGEAALVFEDDARVGDGFDRRLGELCGLIDARHRDFDVAFLGLFRHDEPPGRSPQAVAEVGVEPFVADGFLGGAFAYVISAQGARRLLGIVERDGIQNGIDTFMALKAGELSLLECVPPLAYSPLVFAGEAGDTDIQNDFEPLTDPETVGLPTIDVLVPSALIVAAGDDLGRAAVKPIEPGEVEFGDGLLALIAKDGRHRFELRDGSGEPIAKSPEFQLAGGAVASAERIAIDEGELAVWFSSDGADSVALLDVDEVGELLQSC